MKFIHRLFCWYSLARLTVRAAILEIKIKNRVRTMARLDAIIQDLKEWHNVHRQQVHQGVVVQLNGKPITWDLIENHLIQLRQEVRIVPVKGKLINIVTNKP